MSSKECQVQHWKQHKSACTVIKTKHDKWKKAMNNVLPDGTVNDTKEGPCAICLEETITNPVVMPCGHVFCFACVGQYQQSSTSKEGASCPYCRGEIPDVAERAAERAMLYGDRAIASPKGSEEQKKYAKFSLAEFESIIKLFDPDKNIVAYMMMLHTNAMMLSMADQPEQTINVTKELLVLNEKYYGNLTFDVKDKVSEAKYWQAQAYSDCGKWKDAVKSYKSLIRFQKQLGGNPAAVTLMGYSQAMYELRKYDEAIEMGSTAIETACHKPGVHKYVVRLKRQWEILKKQRELCLGQFCMNFIGIRTICKRIRNFCGS